MWKLSVLCRNGAILRHEFSTRALVRKAFNFACSSDAAKSVCVKDPTGLIIARDFGDYAFVDEHPILMPDEVI